MKCPACGQTIARKSRFCEWCGKPVQQPPSPEAARSTRAFPVAYAILFLILGFGIAFVIFKPRSDRQARQSASTADSSPSAVYPAAVLDIAKEFNCPCGTCNDALDVCTCDEKNGAVEVKHFISQKLAEGHKKPHIVEMVNEKYGGLKQVGSGGPKFEVPRDSPGAGSDLPQGGSTTGQAK